jgi:hypothetical protein
LLRFLRVKISRLDFRVEDLNKTKKKKKTIIIEKGILNIKT